MSFSAEIPFNKIFLYIDDSIDNVDSDSLKVSLEDKIGREVELKKGYLRGKYEEGLAKKVAETKIRDKRKQKTKSPLPKEIQIERDMMRGEKEVLGILYDGHKLNEVFRDLLNGKERKEHTVILTKRLIATLEEHESRYHIRAVLNSIPSIISTSGIVEGPAKPRKYYLSGKAEREDILDFQPMEHDDKKMESAVKSYLLQTIFWRLEGAPFCEREGCRLYNSHWQRGVVQNQVYGKLCDKHKRELEKFKKSALDERHE